MKNIIPLVLILLTTIASCQQKKSNSSSTIKKTSAMINVIIQPVLEMGKSQVFEIRFNQKPDIGSFKMINPDGLTLTNGIAEEHIHKQETGYSLYDYAMPTHLGTIEIPAVSIKVKGKEYTSQPFSITVVDTIQSGDKNAVKMVWVPNRDVYQVKDTIVLTLYEFSKFSNIQHEVPSTIQTPDNNISIKSKKNTITITKHVEIDDLTGINNLQKYLDNKFEILDAGPIFFGEKVIEKLDSSMYIKTPICNIYLLAKEKGNYEFPQSLFEYTIFKSNTDYFSRFEHNEDGSHSITDNGSFKLKITSNKLNIKIE